MSELRTSLVIDLAGNLQRNARKFSDSLGGLSSQGQRHLLGLKRAADLSGKALDTIGNRYTAILSGGGFGMAMRSVGNFETRLTRLGINGKVTDAQLKGLKNQMFEISQERDIGIDPTEALAGIESIIEKTGDLKFAQDNLRNIAIAISATGAAGIDVGGMMAEFQKMGIKGSQDVLKAIDVLNVQGKEGAFTLENIAALGPRVVSAYTAAGRGGVQSLQEMGAALQMIRMGTGSAEMAASAFEATMRTLLDPQKIKQLRQLTGIQVFDAKKLAEGLHVLRPINEVMAEIIQKTKGDVTQLGQVFDAEAMRAFTAAASEFQRTGKIDSLERFYNVMADGTTTLNDSKRAAATYAGAMNRLGSIWLQFADNNLAGPVQALADALDSVKPGTVQRWLETAKYVALTVGGLIALQKIKGIFDARATAAASGGGVAPIPVYVVNGPGLGAGGPAGAAGAASGSRVAKLAGAAQGFLFAGAVGYAIGSEIRKYWALDDNGKQNVKGDGVGYAVAKILAMLGNATAKNALSADSTAVKIKAEHANIRAGITNSSSGRRYAGVAQPSAAQAAALNASGHARISSSGRRYAGAALPSAAVAASQIPTVPSAVSVAPVTAAHPNIARVLAARGNDTPQRGLGSGQSGKEGAGKRPPEKMEGTLNIKIDGPGRVVAMTGTNLKLSVETGRTMDH